MRRNNKIRKSRTRKPRAYHRRGGKMSMGGRSCNPRTGVGCGGSGMMNNSYRKGGTMNNRGCGNAGGAPCGGTQARRGGLMRSGGATNYSHGGNSLCGTYTGNFPACNSDPRCIWNYDDFSCH
tara:strand:+ start:413 stop:781 length:369 start_codon:yes stop_codon:yes gene_type:complete